MKTVPLLSAVLGLAVLFALPGAGLEEARADIAQIFPEWEAWEQACERLEADVEAFSRLRESPLESADDLLRVLEAREAVHRGARRVEGYVSLRLELDATDAEARAARQRVERIVADWESRASPWYAARVLALGWERISEWLDRSPRLAEHRFLLQTMFRSREHALPEPEERLLALADVFQQQTRQVHQALSAVEAPEVSVRLSDGRELAVTPAGARSLPWQMRNAADRRRVRQAWLEALGRRSETYAALLDGVVRRERFVAEARGHADALDAALFGEAIPRSAVDNLLAVAREGSGSLRVYHRLRARALGLDGYGSSDRFLPLLASSGEIPYAEARHLILESAAPLGEEVQGVLRQAFEDGWIDAFERPGKRASGIATLVYGEHPYVLVSYRGSLLDLFSLAHELGHAVHSYLAHRSQPFATSVYSTLTGEAVAAVHEMLLVERLMQGREGEDRAAVLDAAIQSLLRSFYHPAIDADFEIRVHGGGTPATGSALGDLYREVLASYHGDAVRLEPWDRHGWQEVPHFFSSPLYMFRYGLAYAAGSALVGRLTAAEPAERETARRAYLDLLRAGGSGFPTELLARAGADPARPETIRAVLGRLDALVRELARASGPGGAGGAARAGGEGASTRSRFATSLYLFRNISVRESK